jgi:hypothetical protein
MKGRHHSANYIFMSQNIRTTSLKRKTDSRLDHAQMPGCCTQLQQRSLIHLSKNAPFTPILSAVHFQHVHAVATGCR